MKDLVRIVTALTLAVCRELDPMIDEWIPEDIAKEVASRWLKDRPKTTPGTDAWLDQGIKHGQVKVLAEALAHTYFDGWNDGTGEF